MPDSPNVWRIQQKKAMRVGVAVRSSEGFVFFDAFPVKETPDPAPSPKLSAPVYSLRAPCGSDDGFPGVEQERAVWCVWIHGCLACLHTHHADFDDGHLEHSMIRGRECYRRSVK